MSVEPRYNLATKVMSNGVEVIVAGDRSTRPGEPEYLRLISSTVTRPITLAPHTLSHHMSMLLPSNLQSDNDVMKSIRRVDDFKTSTFHTTFIFPTSVVENEETKTTTSTVVTNVKVVIADKTQTSDNKEVTLTTSPVMETQLHKTVLTYLNTILDDDQPLVATSKHTVVNTLLTPSGGDVLEPSEIAPETNTYYATQEFIRTVTDGTESKIVSTTDVVTQVVITDPPATEILTSEPGIIDVTKTYFVTYTYFSTYLEDSETKVTSHVSVSTDIAVEKFTMREKKTPILSTTASEIAEKLTSALDESENDIHSESEDDQLTASDGDIIDEWYEKFKIKSTTESEITRTKAKTKTPVKTKLKTKSATKASTEIEPTSTFSTSTIASSTVTAQGNTLLPGDQVIVIYGNNGETSLIPLSDPAKKKPKNETSNDLLSLSAIGINSMNVLGPVFNAMAGILKNHQKDALKRKNDTVPAKKTPNVNPILSFMSNLAGGESKGAKTTTTPRAPLYIPVGSFADDSDPSGTEERVAILPKPEKWVQEKWPAHHHLDKNRRTHDNTPMPHLEGGIPISPGQVINTNSDVIIGRPSDSGPRPPNFAVKDNVPLDMKPPPIEEQRVHLDPIGQFSTNQGVDSDDLIMKPPPLPKPNRQPPILLQKPQRPQLPSRDSNNLVKPTPPLMNPGRPPKQPHHPHDSGAFDLNPPPPPPSLHHSQILPIPVHLNPDEIVQNYVNPVHLQHDNLAVPNEVLSTAAREIAKVIDRSSGQPLLVNIQPSQVAQVLIPQGSSTALIISEEQSHATKGEVIDDPSPHPEPETVGFIGAEPVLKVDNNEIVHRPVNTMMEVIKGEAVHNHQHAHGSDIVNVRPRPDYDNIGMRPPSEPKPPPPHSPPTSHLQLQLQPNHPHQQPQYTLSKKDPSGIYVDISPPGHLPPPVKTHGSNKAPQQQQPHQQPDNMANHQSGVVQDVPLVAQVQLGSAKPDSAPLNEILLNFDADSQPSHAQDHRPGNNYPADLSPPPPPPRQNRPTNHAPGHSQRYPIPHGKPKYPSLPQPPDFMIPPPKPFDQPMLIPVGANGRPQPGEIMMGQDYAGEEDMETEADDPFKTEDGEEIQESNARPLLPGQVPPEVQKLGQNHSLSTIGVGQTLSFGTVEDSKGDENNPPGLREPETIIGSQMHHNPMGSNSFMNNNEAVVSVGSQPQSGDSAEVNISDSDKMFGMKLPSDNRPNDDGENMTRNDNSDGMLKPGKSDEVMGMSPPPLDRPRRPSRPPRPNPPFKFEKPAQPTAPVNMENDFPPVRSPEMNKKPFKPEDAFPPRLPENFVYREYEINTRKPVHKRPFVTSMPIDSPTSTTEESPTDGQSRPHPGEVVFTPEVTPVVIPIPIERPKPIVHERPPNVNMQKPSRPPTRPPPTFENKPSRLPARPQLPTRRPEPDAPKRGQPPFPFERPSMSADSHFGEKVRPPTQMNPPKPQPPRQPPPSGLDQPPKRPFEQPPRGGDSQSIYEPPPPRQPPQRPYKPPIRQPPTGFDHPPPRPTPVSPPVKPSPIPTRAPPSRPTPSPMPSEFEQPPPKNQHHVVYEEPPRRPTYEPPKFEPPVHRVEPSPHFDNNQHVMGQPHKEIKTTEKPNKENAEQKPLDQDTEQSITSESKEQVINPPVPFEVQTPKPNRRPVQQPPRPFTPTPTTKPVKIPIPTKAEIRPTPVVVKEESTLEPSSNIITMVTSGSTTIFGDLYTDPMLLQPTRVVTSNQGVEFTVSGFPNYQNSSPQKVMVVASTPPISIHTTTLTVTSTMTTVVHSSGQVPITRTVLLTTTLISTIVDKITETQTLVKPTVSTVTQTQTVSTTKTALVVPTAIYPPRPPAKYPTAKPEIFVADPHDKGPEIIVADPHDTIAKPEIFVADPRDKDTMTISVSSSMSKKDHKKDHKNQNDNNQSILVVVTDKPSSGHKDPNILLGGVVAPPVTYPHPKSTTECLPECRPSRNELCVKQEGFMKCVCRPGFARMFPDQPCKPTYTYSMQLMLDRMGADAVHYQQGLQSPGSPKYVRMAQAAKEGLNRMVMQSDLRDIYHGVAINGFQPKKEKTMVDFYVQLSENMEENKVLGVFKKSLRTSNFSLGGTEVFAAREADNIHIQDFNECLNGKFHDCSEHSRCFNLKGTYTCSCKEGFTDISENPLYPGRLCSDIIGCEFCGYHGTCYTRNEQQTCECFQWYTGDRCRINLKVLLIALVTIGAILLALLLVCIVMTCIKRRSSNASRANGSTGYLRYRGPPQAMDKRAMIVDTSSESSVENLPYVTAPPPPPLPQPVMGPPRKPALRQAKRPAPRPQQVDQRDRSLTVMIPRVKYRTGPGGAPVAPHVTMSTFSPDKHLNRTAAQIATEQKLLNYLEAGCSRETSQPMQRPSKEEKRIYDSKPNMNNMNAKNKEPRVFEYEYKSSNMNITDGTSSGERKSKDDRFRRFSDQPPMLHDTNSLHHRKYSAGALVSAGYAVSATGGLIQDIEESTIHSNTLKSNRSQFTTLNRSGDHKTMSEARSYDETLIQPQTRPLRTHYSGSTSSRLHPDEHHTMVERDLGSTFLLPESHLFKPAGDRGSDISNFDSL